MSPQSTLSEKASFSCEGDRFERFASLAMSDLVRATDESFTMHRRVDSKMGHPEFYSAHSVEACPYSFQLKKRKVSIYSASSEENHLNYNADFLSGIFQDVAGIIEKESYTDPSSIPVRNSKVKKNRVSVHGSLNRCSKSYACLNRSSSSRVSNDANSDPNVVDPISDGYSPSSSWQYDSLNLPNLPATISENSYSVVNLTQTSVRAAQVLETPNFIHGQASQNKDGYGWFVEIDDSVEDLTSAALNPTHHSTLKTKDDLSFTVCTAPKKNPAFEAAVEWAKAADTVDNVLGDLPF